MRGSFRNRGAVVALTITLGACRAQHPSTEGAKEEPGQRDSSASDDGPAPKRVAFAEGRLWILSRLGRLSSVSVGELARREEVGLPVALDLCVRDGLPWIVTCDDEKCVSIVLRKHDRVPWSIEARLEERGEDLVAMACSKEAVTLLTKRSVFQLSKGKVRVSRSTWMPPGRHPQPTVTSLLAWRDSVFIGLNAGEWGGGMVRIDMPGGEPQVVDSNSTSGAACSEPLDAKCDPVNAIETAPWDPRCVVVAVGLVHLGPKGRLVEVCDGRIRTLYQTGAVARAPGALAAGLAGTEPFYGLGRSGNVLWATGLNGLYRVERASVTRIKNPSFMVAGEFGLSVDVPGIAVFATRRSADGTLGNGGQTIVLPR